MFAVDAVAAAGVVDAVEVDEVAAGFGASGAEGNEEVCAIAAIRLTLLQSSCARAELTSLVDHISALLLLLQLQL